MPYILLCLLALLILVVAVPPPALAAEPIHLDPANPHYFLFRGKPTVLITSGEHYGAVMNLDFDYVKYLDELQRNGLDLTRLFSGTYVEDWGAGWNTMCPKPGRFICPWARSDQPGYAKGGNKFDLTRWDPAYFTRLRDFVAQAGKRGIVVEMVLFCVYYGDGQWDLCPLNAANNINGIGTKGRTHVYDESDPAMMAVQEKVARKIAEELRGFDNVYFELCNEPYIGGPAIGSPWNDRIAKVVLAAAPHHLIALGVSNGSQKVDHMPLGVSILNYHYCSPPDAVAMDYDLPCAVAFDESGFAGSTADPYRHQAWEFLLAGGATYDNLDWSYTVDSPEGRSTAADPKVGCQDPEAKVQLGYLKSFMDGLDFLHMKPDRAAIKGGVPEGGAAYMLAEPGTCYAAYVLGGGDSLHLQVDLPKGDYTVTWTQPRTGYTTAPVSLDHPGGEAALTPPAYAGEIAVVVRKRG